MDREQQELLAHVITYLEDIAGDCMEQTDTWNKARVSACWHMLNDLVKSMELVKVDPEDL